MGLASTVAAALEVLKVVAKAKDFQLEITNLPWGTAFLQKHWIVSSRSFSIYGEELRCHSVWSGWCTR